ncbi:MAG: chemotaxis protein CheA [Acidobacteria bacterium]|nr:chemotaxis protein CheA [Acidobacteriota bacterium]
MATRKSNALVPPPDVVQAMQALDASMASPADPITSLNQDPQLMQDFLVEAREHLSTIEARMLEIEQGAQNEETLNAAFRSFHTIKGLAGFLDLGVLQEVSHEVESLLDLARTGQLMLDPPRIDVVLRSGDYLAAWLNHIEEAQQGLQTRTPPPPAGLLEKIRAAASPDQSSQPADAAGAPPQQAGEEPGTAKQGPRGETSMLKVETAKLEYLVEMVGELVIGQSMLRHTPELGDVKSPRLQRNIAQLTRVTAEVQKTAMSMRMVPIGQLFRRMSRLVRDLSRKSGKPAELEMRGEDVELDRTIVEELSDPLVHMLRNSMDHGLETPAEREAAGKPHTGRIRLTAAHQAGQIMIGISDDGRGLDRNKILRKAVERGLAQPDAVLTDSEVFHLIFEPGFSTAERVTDVSGRGVGMDVVRKHINRLRGRITITSQPGSGTTFHLEVPLTLAIIDGLVALVGGERYIVPIFAVREMFRPTAGQLFTVENRGEMALVRERLLPVLRLGRRLGVKPRSEDPCEGLMIVGESGSRTFCLLVDELVGKQEVVIKSLGETFHGVSGIAGGAILGDGRVGLILDLSTLAAGVSHAA